MSADQEIFIPENLQGLASTPPLGQTTSEPPEPPKSPSNKRFITAMGVLLLGGLAALWSCGYLFPVGDDELVALARRYAGERLPLGSRIRYWKEEDPINYADIDNAFCFLIVQEPNAKERFVGIHLKRMGRWWHVEP